MANLLRNQISLTEVKKARRDHQGAIMSILHVIKNAIKQYVCEYQFTHTKRVADIAALAGSWKDTHWSLVDPEEYQKNLRKEA